VDFSLASHTSEFNTVRVDAGSVIWYKIRKRNTVSRRQNTGILVV
jgi:hypothetical protein